MLLGGQTLGRESLNKIKNATVYINVKKRIPITDKDIDHYGSGFIISSNGYIITAYHN
ncbi:MAG TPA: hypothetical protein VKS21_03630 [Spirochaetota bacterium]|nr:hypothetical protein [Spirochaetota bacterium]